jgi:hypothetical protein
MILIEIAEGFDAALSRRTAFDIGEVIIRFFTASQFNQKK